MIENSRSAWPAVSAGRASRSVGAHIWRRRRDPILARFKAGGDL